MSKKEDKKSLLTRVLEREEVNKELVELRLDRVRTEEALRLLDAIALAVDKVREVLRKEEKEK